MSTSTAPPVTFSPRTADPFRDMLVDAFLLELSSYEEPDQETIQIWLRKLHATGLAQFLMPVTLASFHQHVSAMPEIQSFALGFSERAVVMSAGSLELSEKIGSYKCQILKHRTVFGSPACVLNKQAASERNIDPKDLTALLDDTPWVFWIYLLLALGTVHSAFPEA